MVPFGVVVDRPNLHLKEQLILQLPAVLAWIVGGYADWQRDGLAAPGAVTEATNAYRASSDALGRFLDEKTLKTSEFGTVRAREIFAAWSGWCHENGEQPGTETAFADAMATLGFSKIKRHGCMTYLGLIFASDSEDAGL